jgi:outer membrane protein assembly factor BamB
VTRISLPGRARVRRTALFHTALVGALLAAVVSPRGASADERCGIDLQNDVCLEANPSCPATSTQLGPNPGSWSSYQRDPQHTGWSPFSGPTCNKVLWTTKLHGSILAAPALAERAIGSTETLYVPVGKIPVCALSPDTGVVQWCKTDNLGKYVDRSAPTIGNGAMLYVGTRDNDMWAIDVPDASSVPAAHVAWRQKVCTDGDVTTPPTISYNGIVYMGSDSLGAGTIMAMCPGEERQIKWCLNPVGGGVRNASPALSGNGQRLYFNIGGGTLGAFDPETGLELWRVQFETPRGIGRAPNHTPVVHPVTDRIYLGTESGIWEIEHTVNAQTGKEGAAARLLFDTRARRERVYTPAALHPLMNMMVFGASRGNSSTLRAIDLEGNLLWEKSMPGGRFRNNPPVIDNDGRIYVALGKTLYAFDSNGTPLWTLPGLKSYSASPVIANGRLYVGQTAGTVLAIGGCAP